MPRAQHPDPDEQELARTRELAAARARELLTAEAPDGALDRVAWAAGVGSVDTVKAEVEHARGEGFTWAQIGLALGEHADTARIKYGPTGYAAQRRYRASRRSEGDQ